MHLHVSRVRTKGKTYEYAQILESYRRPDGMPAHRVVANLGKLEPSEIMQWRTALEAMRSGKALVIAEPASPLRQPPQPIANLKFLDLAVLLELWKGWGLTELFEELMPIGENLVSPAAVVTALTLQRCVEPTPKSMAPEWFAKTALPELLGVAPEQFNNTRLHRVLEELDINGQLLMQRLPRLYQEREGRFVALFVDITDAWFVGEGPHEAQTAKTKEGRFERKINIALLCNESGYPIRWEVIPGRRHDSDAILSTFEAIRGLSWVSDTPVVCDRAAGKTAHLHTMLKSGLRFLTALTRSEFASYTQAIPYQPLLDFELAPGDEPAAEDVARAGELARQAGMEKIAEDLYVLDLKTLVHAEAQTASAERDEGQRDEDSTVGPKDKTVAAMEFGHKLRADLDTGRAGNYRSAGAPYGLTKRQVSKYLAIASLPDDVQQAVLHGEATGLSCNDLERLAKMGEPTLQRAEFNRLVKEVAPRRDGRKARLVAPATAADQSASLLPVKVRGVLYFNPEQFVTQRLGARRTLIQIDAAVAALNRYLAAPQSTSEPPTIAGRMYSELRRHGMVDVYDIEIAKTEVKGRSRYQVLLTLKPEAWAKRRRYDGFCLLVGHPEIQGPAEELCQLYRAKNIIETDFHVIKSLVSLRPFHHRTIEKIRAHVTICMLALLLERTLRKKLAAVNSRFTVRQALSTLQGCMLNMYKVDKPLHRSYRLTLPTEEQHAVLRALRFKHLIDDGNLADRLVPR